MPCCRPTSIDKCCISRCSVALKHSTGQHVPRCSAQMSFKTCISSAARSRRCSSDPGGPMKPSPTGQLSTLAIGTVTCRNDKGPISKAEVQQDAGIIMSSLALMVAVDMCGSAFKQPVKQQQRQSPSPPPPPLPLLLFRAPGACRSTLQTMQQSAQLHATQTP